MNRFALAVALSTTLCSPLAFSQTTLGCDLSRTRGAGPYDYRSERHMLPVVERRHFTTRVERLLGGESTKHPGPDIDYTLDKYPNHHRALLSLVRLGEKLKGDRDPLMPHSISCYFERALSFRGDDTLVRVIYAKHLYRIGEIQGAKHQLGRASQDAADNGLAQHNIGLVYADMGLFDDALAAAHRALRLGYELPALRERLIKAGKWKEDTGEAAAAAASAPDATPKAAP